MVKERFGVVFAPFRLVLFYHQCILSSFKPTDILIKILVISFKRTNESNRIKSNWRNDWLLELNRMNRTIINPATKILFFEWRDCRDLFETPLLFKSSLITKFPYLFGRSYLVVVSALQCCTAFEYSNRVSALQCCTAVQ